MPNKSETLQALKAELESVDATIEKYTKVRHALIEVIKFLGNEQLQDLLSDGGEPSSDADAEETAETMEEETEHIPQESLPALPQDGIEAVRKALAARNQM
jgi:predicted CopG family antitoxin